MDKKPLADEIVECAERHRAAIEAGYICGEIGKMEFIKELHAIGYDYGWLIDRLVDLEPERAKNAQR